MSASLGRTMRPGQHQAPGRGVDEQRFGIAQVRGPVAGRNLVGDQAIGGGVVRNAQQRFGETHQDHSFLRRQIIFAQEGIEAGATRLKIANSFDESLCASRHALALSVRQARTIRKRADNLFLIAEVVAIDGGGNGPISKRSIDWHDGFLL